MHLKSQGKTAIFSALSLKVYEIQRRTVPHFGALEKSVIGKYVISKKVIGKDPPVLNLCANYKIERGLSTLLPELKSFE